MNKPSMNTKTTTSAENGTQEAVLDQAKHAVSNVAAQARDQVTDQLSTQFDSRKDKAVETIGNVADAIRGTSDKLKGVGPLGDVAERAADGIQSVATFFEGKQIGDIVRDVNRFARREPAIFLGAAFAIGLIGGRFLKSSAPRETASSQAYAGQGGGTYDRYEASFDSSYDDVGYDDTFLSHDDLESEIPSYESRRYGSQSGRGTTPTGSRTGQAERGTAQSGSSSLATGTSRGSASAQGSTSTQGGMSQGGAFGTTPTTTSGAIATSAKPASGATADKMGGSSSAGAGTYGTSKTDNTGKSGV